MRRFKMVRHQDVTGVSGEGVVAEGVIFSNGKVAIQWLTPQVGDVKMGSTVVWDDFRAAMKVHGHDGKTEFRFLDNE